MNKIKILIAENEYTIATQFKDFLYEEYPDKISFIKIIGRCDQSKKYLREESVDAVIWDIKLDDCDCYSLAEEIRVIKPTVLIFSEKDDVYKNLVKLYPMDFEKIDFDDVSTKYKNELTYKKIQIGRIGKDDPLSEVNQEVINNFITRSYKKANPITIQFKDQHNKPIPLELFNIIMITPISKDFINVFNSIDEKITNYSWLKHNKLIFLNDGRLFITSTSKNYDSADSIREKILNEYENHFITWKDLLINVNNCDVNFTKDTKQIEIVVRTPSSIKNESVSNYRLESVVYKPLRFTLLPGNNREYSEVKRILQQHQLIVDI